MRPLPLRPPQSTKSFMQLTSHLPTYSRRHSFINIQFIDSNLKNQKNRYIVCYRFSVITDQFNNNNIVIRFSTFDSFQTKTIMSYFWSCFWFCNSIMSYFCFWLKICLQQLFIHRLSSITRLKPLQIDCTMFTRSHKKNKKIKKNLVLAGIRSQHPPFNASKTRLASRHKHRASSVLHPLTHSRTFCR